MKLTYVWLIAIKLNYVNSRHNDVVVSRDPSKLHGSHNMDCALNTKTSLQSAG
jgi:hypothetical protein